MTQTSVPVTNRTVAEVNALPEFIARLRAHVAHWGRAGHSIVPMDAHDLNRLFTIAESTYLPPAPKSAADIVPPPKASS